MAKGGAYHELFDANIRAFIISLHFEISRLYAMEQSQKCRFLTWKMHQNAASKCISGLVNEEKQSIFDTVRGEKPCSM